MENDNPTDKQETAEQEAPEQQAPEQDPQVTLEQFAVELSIRDRRVGLVNGFVFTEKQAKRFKDTESAYQERYEQFVDAPV